MRCMDRLSSVRCSGCNRCGRRLGFCQRDRVPESWVSCIFGDRRRDPRLRYHAARRRVSMRQTSTLLLAVVLAALVGASFPDAC